jgi:hypothetical protein
MAGFCSAGLSGAEYLRNFQFMEAISCSYVDTMGVLVVGTFVFGTIFAVTYIRTDSPIVPFVLFLTIGGTITSVISSPLMGFATVVFLLVGGGVVAYAYREFSI